MFRIMGRYKDWDEEEIDSAESMEEAERLLEEYRVAFGADFKLWIEEAEGD